MSERIDVAGVPCMVKQIVGSRSSQVKVKLFSWRLGFLGEWLGIRLVIRRAHDCASLSPANHLVRFSYDWQEYDKIMPGTWQVHDDTDYNVGVYQ